MNNLKFSKRFFVPKMNVNSLCVIVTDMSLTFYFIKKSHYGFSFNL